MLVKKCDFLPARNVPALVKKKNRLEQETCRGVWVNGSKFKNHLARFLQASKSTRDKKYDNKDILSIYLLLLYFTMI